LPHGSRTCGTGSGRGSRDCEGNCKGSHGSIDIRDGVNRR
jgi:hypothetical protein